jgi:predicted RNA-binding protein Jag
MSGKRLEFDETQAEVYEHAARELAGFVEKTGRSVRVLGVSPPERKLLHTGLNDRADVANTSEGFGLFRYVRLDVQRVASVEEDETDPDMGEGPEE